MKFLKKLFGVLDSESSDEKRINVDRAPRVQLKDSHAIHFELNDTGQAIRIDNVSIGGLGMSRDMTHSFKIDDVVHGRIAIKDQTFEVAARVRHLSERGVGFELTGDHRAFRKAVESYFRVEILVLKFVRVDPRYLKPDPRGEVIWFTDGGLNELLCVRDQHGLVHMHATLFGNYIECGRGVSLRAGLLKADSIRDGNGIKASQLLDLHEATTEMRAVTRTLVQSMDGLPEDLKGEILSKL